MIQLSLLARAEATTPFIARVGSSDARQRGDLELVTSTVDGCVFAGDRGLLTISGVEPEVLAGDVILVEPAIGRARRLIRGGSQHNTLVVTERCDQLCVMCSQPPKKSHVDRFAQFNEACQLAPQNSNLCISGGEPTLYKDELFNMLETVLANRPDLSFQVLSNGQHFDETDLPRLASAAFRQVRWGIPLYAADLTTHDQIVGKPGAFARLLESFVYLLRSGARIELRTVLVAPNVDGLVDLAQLIATYLPFIERWSIMQLENTGFAKNRWASLYVEHRECFASIGAAVDTAMARGVDVALFNFPRCTLPAAYRRLAPPSISDWKRKYAAACEGCRVQPDCSGFFEWHPADAMKVIPL